MYELEQLPKNYLKILDPVLVRSMRNFENVDQDLTRK